MKQLLMQLFARTQTGKFNFYIFTRDLSGKAYHLLSKVKDFYWLSHIKNKYFTAISHYCRLQNQPTGLGYSHEVTGNTLISNCHRTAVLNLIFEEWYNAASRPKYIPKTGSNETGGRTFIKSLANYFCYPLGSSHNITRVHRFVR